MPAICLRSFLSAPNAIGSGFALALSHVVLTFVLFFSSHASMRTGDGELLATMRLTCVGVPRMERQRLLTRSPMYGERRSPISTFEASTAEAAKRSSEDELFEVRMGSMSLHWRARVCIGYCYCWNIAHT